jgi:hypothetical protein
MKILYIHGFNSAGYGDKINHLKEAFGPENVIAPTLPYQPDKAMILLEFLTDSIKDKDKLYILEHPLEGFMLYT